ncbi:MAG: MoaD/ThiS family protein, partial [Candidatus Margulisiibacteriota bacterium]
DTVGQALLDLATNFPKIQQHLYDKDQNLRKFINIYVNDTDIRDADGIHTSLNDNDELSLVPAIAGGR